MLDFLYDDDGVIEGYICEECGGDILLRNGRTWCDWCVEYVPMVRAEAVAGWGVEPIDEDGLS